MAILLLIELPQSDNAPLMTQEQAHKAWLEREVGIHGGIVKIAHRADQLHGFGLDLDPPVHYYKTKDLSDQALTTYYQSLKRELLERIRDEKPYNFDTTVRTMELELITRGLPIPEVALGV